MSDAPDRWLDPATGEPLDGAPIGMLASLHAALTPLRPALTIAGRTIGFAAFDAGANRRARALMAQGVRPGDRIVLSMPNRAAYLEAAFALWKIGAVLRAARLPG